MALSENGDLKYHFLWITHHLFGTLLSDKPFFIENELDGELQIRRPI
jgi:hypothetical protein